MPAIIDVTVSRSGSLFLFQPLTPTAKEWIDGQVGTEATFFGSALVVEHRYAHDLAQGMLDDGLVVE